MKRTYLAAVAAVVLLAVADAAAWAHEEINPASFPVANPVFLTLTAANEKQVKLTKLTLVAPNGISLGAATRDPSGWTSSRTPTTVSWTGGAVDPDHYEHFGYELEAADQPGPLTWKVTLGYADGSSDDTTVQVTATAATATPGATSASSATPTRRANLALLVGIAGLALAVTSLVRGGRRSSPPRPPSTMEQDW